MTPARPEPYNRTVANLKGTYALVVALDKDTDIDVGRLSTVSFPSGYYVYVGSALGGLLPRVRRHIAGGNRTHWHIDYLRRQARVVEVWYTVSGERLECSWYEAAAKMPHAVVPVAGFGSSGCSCHSHLVHFNSMPSPEQFRRKLKVKGLDLQRMLPDEV
ncbi:DUF123 domain-containing protein [Chloroflexota bacterium]